MSEHLFTLDIAGHSSSSSPKTSGLVDSIKLELEFTLEIELRGSAASGTSSILYSMSSEFRVVGKVDSSLLPQSLSSMLKETCLISSTILNLKMVCDKILNHITMTRCLRKIIHTLIQLLKRNRCVGFSFVIFFPSEVECHTDSNRCISHFCPHVIRYS